MEIRAQFYIFEYMNGIFIDINSYLSIDEYFTFQGDTINPGPATLQHPRARRGPEMEQTGTRWPS